LQEKNKVHFILDEAASLGHMECLDDAIDKSKQTREFFEQLKAGEPQIGALGAAREGIQAVAPGLSLSKMLGDIGAELKQQASHGALEMASAIFRGDPYVMYPRTGKDAQSNEGQGLQQGEQQ
jgi:hypothetical protein